VGLPALPLDGQRAGGYQRHRPETTTLYAVVRDNVESLYAAVAAGFDGAALPPFVRREFDGYLACGSGSRRAPAPDFAVTSCWSARERLTGDFRQIARELYFAWSARGSRELIAPWNACRR
jgi:hypothetical protein